MKRREQVRVDTAGRGTLAHNPFSALDGAALPPGPVAAPSPSPDTEAPAKRGRVDIVREVAGRGGKTVTVVRNFTGVSGTERDDIARRLQKALGCGGTIKNGAIELQGDRRDAAAGVLRELGFRPVFAAAQPARTTRSLTLE
jgi:translation initiation factor 1